MSVETELYLVDEVKLNDQVKPAIEYFLDQGDATKVDNLLRETLSGGSFQALLRTNPVLADYLAQGSQDLLKGKLPGTAIDDKTGEVTRNPEFIRQRVTEIVLTRLLVFYWCARYPRGAPVGITLNRGALAGYIRSQSQWIDDMLSLSNEFLWDAPDLKPGVGGDARLLTREQASTLLNALRRVAAPTDSRLRLQYEDLKGLLEIAVKDQRYRILICTG